MLPRPARQPHILWRENFDFAFDVKRLRGVVVFFCRALDVHALRVEQLVAQPEGRRFNRPATYIKPALGGFCYY